MLLTRPHGIGWDERRRRPAPPAPMAGARIEPLQDLRAIAALLVLFQHVAQFPLTTVSDSGAALRQAFGAFGSAGVDLFFVISGFVIAHSMSAERAPAPRLFLLGRALRILPLFWLMSAIYAAQRLWAGDMLSPEMWRNSVTLIPLTGGRDFTYPVLHVGWSLAFELAFYALAALALFQPARRRIPILLMLLVGLSVGGEALGRLEGPAAIFLNPIMFEFALGVIAWTIWRKNLTTRAGATLAVIGVTLFLSGLFVDVGQGFETSPTQIVENVTSLRRAVVWGLPAALLLTGIAALPARDGARGRWLHRIGDASFSLYLVHPMVLFQLRRMGAGGWIGNDLAAMIALLVIPIAVALIVHERIEKPIMRWGKTIVATYG